MVRVALLMTVIGFGSIVFTSTVRAGEETSWPSQLNYLGYMIMRTSNINVIRGLNLSKKQTCALRKLAISLDERVKRPIMDGKADSDVAEVLAVYEELEKKLLSGEQISKEFRKKVTKARMLNADIVRQGLRYDDSKIMCARCHAVPGESIGFKHWGEGHASNKLVKLESDTAHIRGLLGIQGMAYVWAAADEIDAILTAPQQKAMEGFTCCLTPPKNMTDPTRVGQVGDSDKIIEILEKLRSVPWYLKWYGRRRVRALVKKFARVSNPAITNDQEEQLVKETLKVVAEAQGMSPLDFELHKHELAKRVDLRVTKAAQPPQVVRFLRAWFLLVPGSTEVYTKLLNEL